MLAVDVAVGRDVSERLRRQLDALLTLAGSGDTASAQRGQGQPDIDAVRVLAYMYDVRSAEQRGRAVTEYADRLKIAGLTERRKRLSRRASHGRSSANLRCHLFAAVGA